MTANEKIEQVLDYTLQTAASTVPVAWVGTQYAPVIGTNYIERYFLPSEPDAVYIEKAEAERRRGIYQLNIMTSTENAYADSYTIEEQIKTYFKRGYPISYNSVNVQFENVYERQAEFSADWNKKIISIYYRCDI